MLLVPPLLLFDLPGMTRNRARLALLLVFPLAVVGRAVHAEDDPVALFRRDVQPLLAKHCLRCHGPKLQEANLRLDRLDPDLREGSHADQWHEVLNRVNVGEMPPEDEPQPTAKERSAVTEWITGELAWVAKSKRGSSRVVMRRLNRREYGNTLRDLLGVPVEFEKVLPPDGPSAEGFDNDGRTLRMSPLLLEYNARIARHALEKAIVAGPPPPSYRFGFGVQDGKLVTEALPERDGFPQVTRLPRPKLEGRKNRRKEDKGPDWNEDDHILLAPAAPARGTQIPARRGPNPHVRLWLTDFPTEGDVVVRVTARAVEPPSETKDAPWLAVMLGTLLDDGIEYELVQDAVQVTGTEPTVFEFRDRLENLPLPFRNKDLSNRGDLNRMLLGLYNAYDGTTEKSRWPDLRVDRIEFEAPYHATWPPESHSAIFPDSPNREDESVYAREVLQRFMDRAYRRPATPDEVDGMHAIWSQLREETRPPEKKKKKKKEPKVAETAPPKPGLHVDYFTPSPEDARRETLAACRPTKSGVAESVTFELPIVANRESFALRFRGAIRVPADGRYVFSTKTDDGSRLYVGGKPVVDNDGRHGAVEKSGTVKLSAGSHPFEVTYFNALGGHHLEVSWSGPGIEKQPIPPSAFTRSPDASAVPEPSGPSFEETILETLVAVLVSPPFLYITEPGTADEGVRELDDFEVASRLSYFLWSSMPDEELLRLAGEGRLRDPAVLRKQVDRLLASPRSSEFVENFSDQWLELHALDRTAVNKQVFGSLVVGLEDRMRRETHAFFGELLHEDLSALNVLDSDFTVIDPVMAEHYGIDGVGGYGFRRVPLPEGSRRGGVLTQASILTGQSNGTDSHPIKRGSWLLRRLLDDPPPPPPPNVPELDVEDPKLSGLSLKEQLALHREHEACNGCHRKLDPWGVAFEHFDTLGKYRDRVRRGNTPVDAKAELPDGTVVDGLDELKTYLLERRREAFVRSLTGRMLAYALGRSLSFTDDERIDAIAAEFAADDHRLRTLVKTIVTDESFLTK